jgi:hypothetical protein
MHTRRRPANLETYTLAPSWTQELQDEARRQRAREELSRRVENPTEACASAALAHR